MTREREVPGAAVPGRLADERSGPVVALPARIGRYRVLDLLGRGAMGLVYRALDEAIDREVAIKTVTADLPGTAGPDWRARLRREAQAAARCQHPGIVTLYEYGEHQGVPYLVMELITGPSLQEVLVRDEPMALPAALDVIRQTLAAIGYAHARGVIHRDLKPANILMLPSGELKVTDFGIARVGPVAITRAHAAIGTPGYMAMEQWSGGHVDGRADLFAIGALAYQLLTGQLPFTGETVPNLVCQMLAGPPVAAHERNPEVPPHVSAAIARVLATDPDQRFATAAEMAEALFPPTQRAVTAPMDHAQRRITRPFTSSPSPRPAGPPYASGPPPYASGPPPYPSGASPLAQAPAPYAPPPAPAAPPPASPLAGYDLSVEVRELGQLLGPIARVLVKRHAAASASLAELHQRLAGHLPDAAERKAFLRAVSRR